jgi:hypothetical protein
MCKLALALPLAALLAAFLAAPTRADSLSCSSVNGTTLCSKSGSTSCQSVNGKTTCCETVGNRTECRDSPAVNPPRRVQPQDRGQDRDQDQGQPDDDDAPAPLLLPDRNVDISATILGILLLGTGIHPAVQTGMIPVLPDLGSSRLRAIALAETIRRNQEMVLLAGKLPVRRCGINCGVPNSFDRRHRP